MPLTSARSVCVCFSDMIILSHSDMKDSFCRSQQVGLGHAYCAIPSNKEQKRKEMFWRGRVQLCLPLKEDVVARVEMKIWKFFCPSLSSNVKLLSLSLTMLSSYIEQSTTNLAAVV